MSVLIYIDTVEGQVKKSAAEALSYGADLARQLGTTAQGVVIGKADGDLAQLGQYGVEKIVHLNAGSAAQTDPAADAMVLATLMTQHGSSVMVFSHTVAGKAIAPLLSAYTKAGLVTGAVALPDTQNGFTIKRSVFSGKAFAHVRIMTDKKIVSINPNSYKINNGGAPATIESVTLQAPESKITVIKKQQSNNELLLTEAETVVSAGRGLKGPENWGMIEELAKVMGAATACSRPVADAHWRPHNEHVGQTGIAIAPTLYIAIGISGAIQHLAGVNRSKVIVVINKDPEAPFFKAADYGIVGDAFEVVPAFTAAVKKLKGV